MRLTAGLVRGRISLHLRWFRSVIGKAMLKVGSLCFIADSIKSTFLWSAVVCGIDT